MCSSSASPLMSLESNIFTSVTIATILPKDPTVLGVKLIRSSESDFISDDLATTTTTMWHNVGHNVAQSGHHHRHHILLRTTIWSNCHTKRQLSPSWSHLWTWSSWKGPRQLCQQLLVAMWHTKKIKMKHQKCLSGISCTNSGPQNLKTALFQTFSTWHPNTFCSYCLILT